MQLTKREVVIEAVSKESYGIKSKEGVWYNILDGDKKRIEPVFSKLNKGDTIELDADFQLRIYKEIVIKKQAEKKSWTDDMTSLSELLEKGHKKGISEIKSDMIIVDWEKKYAMTKVTVFDKNGKGFDAHGDATQENCGSDNNEKGKKIRKHWIRMSESRALARALRFFVGDGKVAKEETEEGEDSFGNK